MLRNLKDPRIQIENAEVTGWSVRQTYNGGLVSSVAVNAGELFVFVAGEAVLTATGEMVFPLLDGCRARSILLGGAYPELAPWWRFQALQIIESGTVRFYSHQAGTLLAGCILAPTLVSSLVNPNTAERVPGNRITISGPGYEAGPVENADLEHPGTLVSVPQHSIVAAMEDDDVTAHPGLNGGNTAVLSNLWGDRCYIGNPPQYHQLAVAQVTTAGLFGLESGGGFEYPYWVIAPRASSITVSR